jgi:hypothetical protein
MTAYRNFIDDFPSRCCDILNIAKRPAISRGREVTLTLLVASAGFIVPYERLGDHPSGDSTRFAEAAEKLRKLLDEPFVSSVLYNKTNSTWHDGKVVSVNDYPESWEGLQKRRPFSKDKKVGTTLNLLRNALAHGNIFTSGKNRDLIEAIIFIKRNFNSDGVIRDYSFIYVAPQEFRDFLERWFDFLMGLRISQEAAFGILKDAA